MVHLGTCVLTQAQHRAVRALKGTEVVGLWDVCLTQPEARKGLISWERGCSSLGVRFSSDSCHQATSSDHAEPQTSRKTLGEDRMTQTKWRESTWQQVTSSLG